MKEIMIYGSMKDQLGTLMSMETFWSYGINDPMVIRIKFPDGVDSTWVIGRELLAQAVYRGEKAGVGDILITPVGNGIILQLFGQDPDTDKWFDSRSMYLKRDLRRFLDLSYIECSEDEAIAWSVEDLCKRLGVTQ